MVFEQSRKTARLLGLRLLQATIPADEIGLFDPTLLERRPVFSQGRFCVLVLQDRRQGYRRCQIGRNCRVRVRDAG